MALDRTIEKAVDNVVGIMVALLLMAFLIPVAFDIMFSVDTSSWGSNVVTIWENLPVIAAVGLLLSIIYMAVVRR